MLLASLTTLPAFLFVIYIATNECAEVLRRAEREARFVAEMASREHAHQVEGARAGLAHSAGGRVGDETACTAITILTREGQARA